MFRRKIPHVPGERVLDETGQETKCWVDWPTAGSNDELLHFARLHPPDHVHSHEVAILISSAVAGGPEAILLVPLQPNNRRHGHLVRDVYLHAVTIGITD